MRNWQQDVQFFSKPIASLSQLYQSDLESTFHILKNANIKTVTISSAGPIIVYPFLYPYQYNQPTRLDIYGLLQSPSGTKQRSQGAAQCTLNTKKPATSAGFFCACDLTLPPHDLDDLVVIVLIALRL